MKKLKLLFLFLSLTTLASCSKDEKKSDSENIVGTWRMTAFSYEEIITTEANGETSTITFSGVATQLNDLQFTFLEDGTATTNGNSITLEITTDFMGESHTEEVQTETNTDLGAYEINGNIIVFKEANEVVQQFTIVELNGTKLHLVENSTETSGNEETVTTTDLQFIRI